MEGEGRALAEDALERPLTAHGAYQTITDGQAQPGPAVFARSALIGLGKGFEQTRQAIGGDARTGVDDGEPHVPRRIGNRFDGNQHTPGLGEFDGIVGEVSQHLAQANGIADDDRYARIHKYRQVQPLADRAFHEQAGDVLGDLGQVNRDGLHLELARLDLREIENVIDDAEQRLARFGDDVGIAFLASREIGSRQHLAEGEDAVHRRADLVAHHRQKVGLGGVCALGGLLGDSEFRRPRGDLPLQSGHLGGDFLIAHPNAVEHVIEAADQVPQLPFGPDLGGPGIVLGLPDAVDEGSEADDRLTDPSGHLHGDQQPGHQRHAGTRKADQDRGQDA